MTEADQGQEAEIPLLRTVNPDEIKTVTTRGSALSSVMLVSQDKHLLKQILCTTTFGKEVKKIY